MIEVNLEGNNFLDRQYQSDSVKNSAQTGTPLACDIVGQWRQWTNAKEINIQCSSPSRQGKAKVESKAIQLPTVQAIICVRAVTVEVRNPDVS